jgi:nitroreductase
LCNEPVKLTFFGAKYRQRTNKELIVQLLQAMNERRSIRGFKPDPIAKETLTDILQTAGRSPSYTNTQPWEVTVVTGKRRDALSQVLYDLAAAGTAGRADVPVPKVWSEATALRSKTHNINRFAALGVARDDTERRNHLRLENFRFFGAPCVMFVWMDEALGPWSNMDVGGFLHGLSLAAMGHGLGTCLQASLANYPDAIRECLGIPDNKKLLVGLSMGVPDLQAPLNAYRSARMPLEEFVTWIE